MKPWLILKLGDTLPALAASHGDFEDWVLRGSGLTRAKTVIVNAPAGDPLPSPGTLSGAIITGSHAMVTDHLPWSEAVAVWLRDAVAAGLPVLGICYGHQLLGYALGGEVGDNPNGREIGTVTVTLKPYERTGMLFDAPARPSFPAHVAHAQSILHLPPGAQVCGVTAREPNALVAFAPGVWGVQFHPEFDRKATQAYILAHQDELRAEGQNPAALLDAVCETPEATQILRNFVEREVNK
ncbi:MAG: glutamine amidotransferase [Anaerolineae bacterium]|nr:glutamine amidotransferase [Anaerolineae bacterium]